MSVSLRTSRNIVSSSLFSPDLCSCFLPRHITRLHLYTNYTQLALDDPNSPYIRAGNYIKYGQTLLKNAENYNREAVFGTAEIPSLEAPELTHILFEDACDIPRSRFEHLDIEIDDYFFANCRTIGTGIFKKGFYALWMELVGTCDGSTTHTDTHILRMGTHVERMLL